MNVFFAISAARWSMATAMITPPFQLLRHLMVLVGMLVLVTAVSPALGHEDHDPQVGSNDRRMVDRNHQPATPDAVVDDAHHDHDHDHDHEDEVVTFTPSQLQEFGITTALAAYGDLQQTRSFRGQVLFDPRQKRNVHARFPGIVQRVAVAPGNEVKAGDELARVEASDSLRSYAVVAPIGGTVIEQGYQQGELTAGRALFTLVNRQQLLVEFPLFSRDLANIHPGQRIVINSTGRHTDVSLESVLPDAANPAVHYARAVLDNRNGQWQPGEWLELTALTDHRTGLLLIDRRALQTSEQRSVVFVRKDDHFMVRPVIIGRRNGDLVEILSGLEAGEEYAVANSYLVRAELEKSGAAHSH